MQQIGEVCGSTAIPGTCATRLPANPIDVKRYSLLYEVVKWLISDNEGERVAALKNAPLGTSHSIMENVSP
jgi:hypothetical protein